MHNACSSAGGSGGDTRFWGAGQQDGGDKGERHETCTQCESRGPLIRPWPFHWRSQLHLREGLVGEGKLRTKENLLDLSTPFQKNGKDDRENEENGLR